MIYFEKEDCVKVIDIAFKELDKRYEPTKGYSIFELKCNGKHEPFLELYFTIAEAMNVIMKEVTKEYDC